MRRYALGLGVGVLALACASTATATPFTWTGLSPVANFSSAGNWNGAAPLSTATSLTFGHLSAPCNAPSPSDTCYTALNDESGLSVNSISFDGSQRYKITGNLIGLGAGGLTAVDGGGNSLGGWGIPLDLTASQTWSVTGPLSMFAPLVGTGSALTVNFKHTPGTTTLWSLSTGDSEIGPIQLNGGQLQLGDPTAAMSLNASDGQPLRLSNSDLFMAGSASVGPLTSVHSRVDLSTEPLTVDGPVSLDSHSTLSSLIRTPTLGGVGLLSATGAVTLAGNLDLEQIGAGGPGSPCSALPTGKTISIVSAEGPLTGTFANAPAGATLATFGGCPRGQGTTTLAKIGYTPHSVTETIVPVPSLVSVKAALAATVKPLVKHPKIRSLLKHGGYKTVWPAFAGQLSLDVNAKAHGKQVLVAFINASFNGAQQTAVTVKLTGAGRRLLKRVRTLKVHVVDVFAPAWGFVVLHVNKTLTLKR